MIIVDSTDEAGPGEVLFGEAFYADCRARLRPGGVLAGQLGSCNPFGELDQLARRQARLAAVFADAGLYTASVPTFIGGSYGFGFASDDPALRQLGVGELTTRPVPGGLRHYAPAVQRRGFRASAVARRGARRRRRVALRCNPCPVIPGDERKTAAHGPVQHGAAPASLSHSAKWVTIRARACLRR